MSSSDTHTPGWLPDTGSRSDFETGAQRDAMRGKGLPSHLPTRALMRASKRFEAGAIKYDDHNWRRGIPLSRYVDATYRHLWQFLEGDRQEDHLGAVIWNALCLSETYDMVNNGELPEAINDIGVHIIQGRDRKSTDCGDSPVQDEGSTPSPSTTITEGR